MYSHHQATGWEFAALVYDAWKFSHTLSLVNIFLGDSLDDYLVVECPTMEDAEKLFNTLPSEFNLPRVSLWEKGKLVRDSADQKESRNG